MKSARHYSLKVLIRLYMSIVVLLIVFALLITLARLATPILKNYRAQIAQWTSSIVKKPVEIGSIKATWTGFSPAIDFQNVAVLQPGSKEVLFFLKDFQISINLLHSLFARHWVIDKLYAYGMKMVVIQKADQSWYVKGFQLGDAEDKSLGDITERFSSVVQWILYQPSIQLEGIHLVLMPYNHRTINVSSMDLTISNSGNAHYFRGQANVGDKKRSPLNIAIDLVGDADKIDALSGKLYLQGNNIAINNWLSSEEYYGFGYKDGKANVKLWADWLNNQVNNVQAQLNVSHLKLTPTQSGKPLLINQLNAIMSWQRAVDGSWQVAVSEKDSMMDDQTLPDAQVGLWFDSANTPTAVSIKNLSLANIDAVMSRFTLIPQKIQTLWQALHPTGTIKQVQVTLQTGDKYHAVGNVTNFGVNEYRSFPGLTNITSVFNVTDAQGTVELTSKESQLSYLKLFRQSFALQAFDVQAQWQFDNGIFNLQAYQIALKTPELNFQSQFALTIPRDKAPYLSLLAQFQEKDLAKVQQFFPAKTLAPSLMRWFDHAFVGGVGVNGKIILQGELDKYPFLRNEGQYLSQLTINQMDLNYADGWPIINKLTGVLTFHKSTMDLVASSGQLYGNTIKKLSAIIPDLNADVKTKGGAHLFVDGLIMLPDMTKAKEFVQKSPLQNTVGKALESLVLTGNGQLVLKLNIPVDGGVTKTNGTLSFEHLQLAVPEWNLNFPNVKGNIYFTEASLSSSPLVTTFYKQPATINIKTLSSPKERVTRISLDSQFAMSDLKTYFDLQRLNFIDGQTPFQAIIDVSTIKPTHIAVRSDFKGIKIDLPKPYAKSVTVPHTFRLDAYLPDNQPPLIRMEYQDLFGLIMAFGKDKQKVTLSRAQIHLGRGGYLLQKEPGLYITGNLNNFNWEEWRPILLPYLTETEVGPQTSTANSLLKKIDLNIDNLVGYKQQLKQAHVIIDHQPTQWKVAINSNNIVGALTIAEHIKEKGIQAGFSKLVLTLFGDKSNTKDLDPTKIFPIKLNAASVNYRGKDFGAITLDIVPVKNGIQIAKLAIDNKLYQLDTQGLWLRINGQDHSTFTGSLQTANLGALLLEEDFTTHLSGAKGHADFSLSWPDSPDNFQTTDLAGDVNAQFTDGTIVGLDAATNEKIGLGKLINVLSLQSITQKLMLNFNDINKDGFYFSKACGKLDIDKGQLHTDEFYLDGPVAEIYISGNVGLKLKNYDLTMKLNPYFTSSLPLIATIAGGPLVGAATWAASKIVRYGIEKAILYEYHIGGTWADPIITNMNKNAVDKNITVAPKVNNATH